ncbi:MAG: STAS domain-containing protein [Ignavibacteriaceae bacterium]
MLEIKTEDFGSYKEIKLTGRIDGITSLDVEKSIDSLIAQGERTIVVDLSPVVYISSAGLRIFLASQKELKKIDGSLILKSPPKSVQQVFDISGFNNLFRIVKDQAELSVLFSGHKSNPQVEQKEINGIKFDVMELDNRKGTYFSIGDYTKQKTSEYEAPDVVEITQNKFNFALGLATMGNDFGDYKNYFGETIVINNNIFFYPAIRAAKVDFILEEERVESESLKFLNGIGVKGKVNTLALIKGGDRLLTLKEIIEALSTFPKSNLFGIVFLAISGGILGMNLKKVPVKSEHSVADIFDGTTFHEWFDFPVEPLYANNILAGFGLAVKDKTLLPEDMQKHFSAATNSHIHALIMQKEYLSYNIEEFEKEMKRVFRDMDSVKVQHLMGDSFFKSGYFGIIEMES